MATNLRSSIVGVFTDQVTAEQAVQALEGAGFDHEQMWYSSPGGASSFFADIKSLFTGTDTVSGNLVKKLTDMGLSEEEAHYSANEFRAGRSVVAVKAPGSEQEAMAILMRYGASHYNVSDVPKDTAASGPADTTYEEPPTSHAPHDAGSVPEVVSTPPMESTMEPVSATPTPHESAPEVQEPAPATEEPVQPIEEGYSQGTLAGTLPEPSDNYVFQESPPIPVTTEQADDAALPQSEMQQYTPPSESLLEKAFQATQPSAATMEPVDHETRMQEMQRQILEVQRQLEEARARLQSAKERESRFKDAQKQLQDLQEQLRATLDELSKIEESVAQLGE